MNGAVFGSESVNAAAIRSSSHCGRGAVDVNMPGDRENLEIDRRDCTAFLIRDERVSGEALGLGPGTSSQAGSSTEQQRSPRQHGIIFSCGRGVSNGNNEGATVPVAPPGEKKEISSPARTYGAQSQPGNSP